MLSSFKEVSDLPDSILLLIPTRRADLLLPQLPCPQNHSKTFLFFTWNAIVLESMWSVCFIFGGTLSFYVSWELQIFSHRNYETSLHLTRQICTTWRKALVARAVYCSLWSKERGKFGYWTTWSNLDKERCLLLLLNKCAHYLLKDWEMLWIEVPYFFFLFP